MVVCLILLVTPSEYSRFIILWNNFMNIYSVQTQSFVDFIIFLMPIENVLFDNNRDFEEVQKFFTYHCSKKKITMIYYVWCLSDGSQKRTKAFLTVQQLKKIREHQRNEIGRQNYKYFISSGLTTDYELKKAES